ncbi:hypothetical protein ACOMHN_062358 [Nucella lapillus]
MEPRWSLLENRVKHGDRACVKAKTLPKTEKSIFSSFVRANGPAEKKAAVELWEGTPQGKGKQPSWAAQGSVRNGVGVSRRGQSCSASRPEQWYCSYTCPVYQTRSASGGRTTTSTMPASSFVLLRGERT